MQHLEHILECIHDKHIFIQTHNFPDPDAIASAYGLKVLLEKRELGQRFVIKEELTIRLRQRWHSCLQLTLLSRRKLRICLQNPRLFWWIPKRATRMS